MSDGVKPDAEATGTRSARGRPGGIPSELTGSAAGTKRNWDVIVTKAVVLLGAILLILRLGFFEPFSIPSGSMKPTLLVGDFVLVSSFSYGYSRYSFPFVDAPISGRIFGSLPRRGDVAVFRLPRDPSVDYIKRIVGLPGDRIQMIDGVLNINGQAVRLERVEDGFDNDPHIGTVEQFVETLPNGASYRIFKHHGH